MNRAATERASSHARALRSARGRGSVEVWPGVVRIIAGHAALECYGVMGMASRNVREGMATRFLGRSAHRGVELREVDGKLELDLFVIVQYGVRITEVARNLQDAVGFAVERAVGIDVPVVNVFVQGVHDDSPTA
ncbi:MAG TPA: Asp23/Gls24 family envelope stress response protein [Candidatus Acidoferrales bacterium]|nr:Asp23/Gls24 family envelope stress response protein [Candidatus Acidoferrales bacterium]